MPRRGRVVVDVVWDNLQPAELTERFKLTVHNETRERPVYALALARADRRLGPQLQKSSRDCATAKGPEGCGQSIGPGYIQSRGRTMAQFAESLAQLTNTGSSLNRLIVDRTGLEGPYEVTLKFTPETFRLQARLHQGFRRSIRMGRQSSRRCRSSSD